MRRLPLIFLAICLLCLGSAAVARAQTIVVTHRIIHVFMLSGQLGRNCASDRMNSREGLINS